jgi:hypothetical protein
MGGRRTNLALLGLLGAAFLTGWLAFSLNSWSARLTLIVHAAAGLAIVGLLPWKSMLSHRSLLRRGGAGLWLGSVLALLLLVSLVFGLFHSSGFPYLWTTPFLSAVPVLRDLTAVELHVGAAIALLPFAIWHVVVRPVRVRRTDLSRRAMLRLGLLLGATAVALTVLPAGKRALTGSYRLDALPVTSWMFDATPPARLESWTLLAGARAWTYPELASFRDRVHAVIDCTGGWYSDQEWEGVFLSRLLPPSQLAGALSVSVRSATGYPRRFDLADLPRLLLATRVGGVELAPGNGHPVRLVAPGMRGYWWVKWVVELRPEPVPRWFQSPYPVQ